MAACRESVTPQEQVTAQIFLPILSQGENAGDVFFLSRLDGNAITAEVILDTLEIILVAELETRQAA
jgi:hypothetical protein